jgi:type I restriction enzyme M protein
MYGRELFDKSLARKTNNLLFVKIQQDGFDLGAQRREIDKNDLPQALQIIKKYKSAVRNGELYELNSDDKKLAHLVTNEVVAKSGDYNLSGDRYKEVANSTHQKWPMVELGNDRYFSIESGGTPDSNNPEYWNGNINWVTLVDLPNGNFITEIINTKRTITEMGLKNSSAKLLQENSILVSSRATLGRIAINKIKLATNQGFKNILVKDFNEVNPNYIAYLMTKKVDEMINMASGGTFKEISKSNFSRIKIPLPPLEIQNEIVDQIEVKQQAVEAAKAVMKNLEREKQYFGQSLIKLDDVDWVELKEVCDITSSKRIYQSDYVDIGVPFYRSKEIIELSKKRNISTHLFISDEKYNELKVKFGTPKKGDLLITAVGSIGFVYTVPETKDFYFKDGNLLWLRNLSPRLDPSYLKNILSYTLLDNIKQLTNGGAYNALTIERLDKLQVPVPSLEIQKQLVEEIEDLEKIIEANRRLIKIMEKKIDIILKDI